MTELEMTSALGLAPESTLTVDLGPSATEIEAAAAVVRDLARQDHEAALDNGDDPADIDPETEIATWALTVHAGGRECREAIDLLGRAEAARVYAAELADILRTDANPRDLDEPDIRVSDVLEVERGADEDLGFRDFHVVLTVDDAPTAGCVTLAVDQSTRALSSTWAPSLDYWTEWTLTAALESLTGHDRRRAIAEIEAACQDLARQLDGGA